MNAGEQKQAKGGGVWWTIGGVAALLAGIAVVALAIRWSDRTIDEQSHPQPSAATSAAVVQEREPVSDVGDCDVALTLTAADGGRNLDLLFSARNVQRNLLLEPRSRTKRASATHERRERENGDGTGGDAYGAGAEGNRVRRG
jgi:hypothetical protein